MVFVFFEKSYLDTLAFFFLTILVIVFVEFRYIIQTPTTHLIKGDETISYKIKQKVCLKNFVCCFIFIWFIYYLNLYFKDKSNRSTFTLYFWNQWNY